MQNINACFILHGQLLSFMWIDYDIIKYGTTGRLLI